MEYNFSKEEIDKMRENMSKITTHIPPNLANYVWDTFKKVGGNGPKPCTCPSSAKLWRGAVEKINSFLKSYVD